jgi:hypothetical protein
VSNSSVAVDVKQSDTSPKGDRSSKVDKSLEVKSKSLQAEYDNIITGGRSQYKGNEDWLAPTMILSNR